MAVAPATKSFSPSTCPKLPVFGRHYTANIFRLPTFLTTSKSLAVATPGTSLLKPTVAVKSASFGTGSTFHGSCYVVGDNIDTDQIIPAEHLTLLPSKPDEYRKLGSLALVGLPSASYPVPFVEPGETSARFSVIIAGDNFGCGSSREHAPISISASGARVVVAESYARIFFRNCVATGVLYPLESEEVGIWKECSTGDIVTVDLNVNSLINHTKGRSTS
ncbi:hypothetical protein HPP92_020921 [Vanilla planifolia]|uniref:Aconitase A/isopropylmalate dehydratase small subunit swivel domain-containing protein n=1 Tax=Vanilla planifolia TaxID=51239 RepID=A0A835PVP7_VANPL|nr:hypothetical protein HPP92_020921 [Vanilla planifolia]